MTQPAGQHTPMDNGFEVFVYGQIAEHLIEGTNPEPITGAIDREHKRRLAKLQAPAMLAALKAMLESHGEEIDVVNKSAMKCWCPACKGTRGLLRAVEGG